MDEAIPSSSVPTTAPPLNKVHFRKIGEQIAELDGSQTELLVRIQKLKEEVQNWRQNVDTQVKTYKEELLELKKKLSSDVDHLKSEVKEVKTSLHVRQNSWAFNLWNFGMKDASESEESKENDQEFNDNIVKKNRDKEERTTSSDHTEIDA